MVVDSLYDLREQHAAGFTRKTPTDNDRVDCVPDLLNRPLRIFFPLLLAYSRQEQIADRRDDQVAFEPKVPSAFVTVQSHLLLLVFEAPLDSPSLEGNLKKHRQRRLLDRIADEELQFAVENIAGDHQPQRHARQAVAALQRHAKSFGFPDDRPFLTILDSISYPAFRLHRLAVPKHRLHAARLCLTALHARRFLVVLPVARSGYVRSAQVAP